MLTFQALGGQALAVNAFQEYGMEYCVCVCVCCNCSVYARQGQGNSTVDVMSLRIRVLDRKIRWTFHKHKSLGLLGGTIERHRNRNETIQIWEERKLLQRGRGASSSTSGQRTDSEQTGNNQLCPPAGTYPRYPIKLMQGTSLWQRHPNTPRPVAPSRLGLNRAAG